MLPNTLSQRIAKFALAIFTLILIGTIGYATVEQWSLIDGFYMTVITVSTVGYGEINELTGAGRAFTSVLILCSIICMSCCTAGITSMIIEGRISGAYEQRRAKKMAGSMKGHTIICGSGLLARAIVAPLAQRKHPVVLVGDQPKQLALVRSHFPNVPIIESCATNEVALAQANLLAASFVVAATDVEIDNLLIAITCKDLRPNLPVYAISLDGSIAGRMIKAGVDEVVCPFQLGGEKIADLIGQAAPGACHQMPIGVDLAAHLADLTAQLESSE